MSHDRLGQRSSRTRSVTSGHRYRFEQFQIDYERMTAARTMCVTAHRWPGYGIGVAGVC